MKTAWLLIKETFREWQADKVPRLGAALAYYSLFSIGPILLMGITIASFAFGEQAVTGELYQQLRGLIGDTGAEAVQAVLANTRRSGAAGFAGVMSAATLLLAATGVVAELKGALNTIWKVEVRPGRGLRVFFKKYIVSLAAVIAVGMSLIASLILSTVVGVAGRFLEGWLPVPEALLYFADFATLFLVLTLLLAAMFRFLPDVRLSFRIVLPGAALTTLLFMAGKVLIGLYLGKVAIGSTFGAAGSLVVLLVWIYYSSQIVFFGAEFVEVYARHRGLQPEPEPDAWRVRLERVEDPTAPPHLGKSEGAFT